MRDLRIVICALFVILAVPVTVAAQDGTAGEMNSGSFYSFYGVGFPVDLSIAQEKGLGIMGVSLDNGQASTMQNPAIWGRNAFTTATSGFDLYKYSASDQQTTSENGLLQASFLQITLPLSREKVGFSASLYPATRSNYRILDRQTLYPGLGDTLNYVADNQGVGGVNKLEFGLGWSINKHLSVGYAPAFVFMSKTNDQYLYFDQSGYSNVNNREEVSGSGYGHRFGLLFSSRRLFSSSDRISVGASLTLPVSFDVEERVKSDKVVDGVEQEVQVGTTKKGNLKLPLEINTGLTYYPSSLVNLSLEGQMQRWSEFEYTLSPAAEEVMSDRYQLGFGGQYHPYRLGSSRFLSNFKYSAGVKYDTGHLTINNQDVNTLWLTAGLGILSPRRSQSTVDISFQYGFRGTTNNNLVKEDIWAINFSVNLAELMFFRRKLR